MRTIMHHLAETQSVANTFMAGNVALKAPVYDWGYTGRFGDEINWGNAIVLVPSLLYDLYGDTTVMETYYDHLIRFVEYIQRERFQGHIVKAALGDWVEASDGPGAQTSGRITGTWGYYLTIKAMASIARITGHKADEDRYTRLSGQIRDAFNAAFWNDARGRYTNTGNNGTSTATQIAQALALDSGFVPPERHQQALDSLVELTYSSGSNRTSGPHLSGGTIGLGPIVRALSPGGWDDILWSAVQQNDQPSYRYFMTPTVTNPNGFTTIGEEWNRSASKNHMILAQIDEWFHAGVAGVQFEPFSKPFMSSYLDSNSTSFDEENNGQGRLVFHPRAVGDLTRARGSYQLPQGEARSEWTRAPNGTFELSVTVPPNTRGEVRMPITSAAGEDQVNASHWARFIRRDGDCAVYTVPSGRHKFSTTAISRS